MAVYGVTPDGYNKKTFNVILSEVEAGARTSFGAPNLDVQDPAGFLGASYKPLIDQISELWNLGEAVYNAPDPRRSTGQSYDAVGALRGVTRNKAERGSYDGAQLEFDAAVPGSVVRGKIRFNVAGQPENIWMNSEEFTISGAGTYVVKVESELPGSDKQLPQGAIIEILEGPGELQGVTIPDDDAVNGTDLEDETNWRTRSEATINGEQTKVGSAVEDVAGVIAARVVEAPGEIRVILNDEGGNANDDLIAQAIYDSKCQGVLTLGSESGDAIDELGETVPLNFDRVTIVEAYADVTVFAPEGTSVAAIKSAVQSKQPTLGGQTVYWSQVNGAVVGVEGVEDVTTLFIGTSPGPTGTANLTAGPFEQYRFLDANINVTVNT